MNKTLKTKIFAALIHFAISIIAVSAVLGLIYTLWYPNYFAEASGVIKILMIILIVDVCLGPFLTFVIYNEKKKELKRDICIIAAIQLAALIYGIYTISAARPAYVVFAVDRFEITYINDLTKENTASAKIDMFKNTPKLWRKATWISAQKPTDIEEHNDLTFSGATGGYDLAQLPKYYRALEESKDEIIRRAKPVKLLKNKLMKEDLNYAVTRYNDESKYGFIPLSGKIKDLSVVINKEEFSIDAVLPVDPW